MITILAIEKNSIADHLGIKPGATLISINHKPINDLLDYRFYNSSEHLEVRIEQNKQHIIFDIKKEYHEDLGLIVDELKMRQCDNKCVFCFVHQNPRGLRKSLYFKDEDYRFSFLYGHYVTLSNTTRQDLKRIVEQRLTPLYISVHSTDEKLRKYLLGIKANDHLLDKIRYLTHHGIELNCQIVLCPGLNDDAQLMKTIRDLKPFFPMVRSIAIVPVGLTRYRRHLPALKPVTLDYCLKFIPWINSVREDLKKELHSSFVYLSDEFYLRSDQEIPATEYYEEFYQLENGVGLTRDFIQRTHDELPALISQHPELKLTFVSSKLGAMALKKYLMPLLRRLTGIDVKLYQIANYFYGTSIGVAGLLVGQDIFRQLRHRRLSDYVILPPQVLNYDGLFLDDWTVTQLEEKLQRKIFIFPDSFQKLFENISREAAAYTEEQKRKIRHSGPSLFVAEKMKSNERFFTMALHTSNDKSESWCKR